MFYKNTDNCRVFLINTTDNEAGKDQTVEENENAKGFLIYTIIIYLINSKVK